MGLSSVTSVQRPSRPAGVAFLLLPTPARRRLKRALLGRIRPRRRRPPFASLLVRGICRQGFHVVPSPPWEVAVGEGFPVECFCCLRGAKRRSGWHYTRAVLAYKRPFACRQP